MICDNSFNFSNQQSLSGTSDVLSTNVWDAGSAKKVFAGEFIGRIQVTVSAIASTGSDYTYRARFVGADDASLSSNVEILDDTGICLAGQAAPLVYSLRPANQKNTKRYYGVIHKLAGTTPTATASAQLVHTGQSQMVP